MNHGYSFADVQRLVEGEFSIRDNDGVRHHEEAVPTWADLRSLAESTGQIGALDAVLDTELAIAALRSHDPRAAAVATLTLFGYEEAEIGQALRCRPHTLGNLKHIARGFLAAWLSEDAA